LEKLVIIADSGLLSSQNIKELQEKGYEFILGARIKNESNDIKEKILSLELKNGEAHIIINFAVYKVYKELERQLKEKKATISPEKAIEIAENIHEITIKLADKTIKKVIILTDEQKYLSRLFDFGC